MRKNNPRRAKDRPTAASKTAIRSGATPIFSTFEVLESRTFLSATPLFDNNQTGVLDQVVAQAAPAISGAAPLAYAATTESSVVAAPMADPLPNNTVVSVPGTSWVNSSFTPRNTAFELSFDAVPAQANGDNVIGLSNGAANSYKSLAAIVRFNNAGQIDVRNGASYQSDASVSYSPGVSYHFRFEVDPTVGVYSVYVTPQGGTEILLASNYSFRTEQSAQQVLNNLAAVNTSGSVTLSNILVQASAGQIASELPVVPTGLAATPSSSSQVNLTWNASLGGTNVSVMRSTDGVNFVVLTTLSSGTSGYQDNGVAPATTYYYELFATNSYGNSAPTAAVSVTTSAAPTAPATPVGLTGTAVSSSKIDLMWIAPADGSPVSVMRSTNGVNYTVLTTLAGASNSYMDTSVSPSTNYFYRIVATDSYGNSAPTSPVSVTTPAAPTMPSTPTIGAAWTNIPLSTTQTTAFELSFDASPTQQGVDTVIGVSGSTVNAYQQLAAIVRFNVNNQIDARNGSGYTADQALGYTAGVSYHFRLVIDPTQQIYSVYVTPQGGSEVLLASNYAFRSEQSSLTTISELAGYSTVGGATVDNVAITALASAPGMPSGLSATAASTTQINLAWSNAAGSTGTTVLRSTDGVNFSAVATVGSGITSYPDTGLAANTTYYYEIYNSNATGNSPVTASASAATSAPPPPVTPPPVVTPPTGGSVEPNATNTGPTNASILVPSGSITVTVAGTVIQNVSVTGTIVIKAANVTIKNFKIDAAGGTYGVQVLSGGSVTLEDGEIINAMGGGVFGNNWTALRLNIHEMGSDATDGGGNNTLEDCWIHDIGMSPGAHADGIQLNNGDNIVIEGNNFDLPWWSQVGSQVYRANSCIFMNGYVYNYLDGTVISGNWLDGGNYSIYALGQTNTVVSNNIFGEDYQYGFIDGTVATWTGNTDGVTGQAI